MSVSQFKRREFITLLGGTAVTWPLTVRAQQPDRIRLIGVLMAFAESDPAAQSQVAAFRGALAKLGWTEGRNLRIELRWGAGDANRISTFARELVELRPDAIVGQTTPVTSALARETRTIPIVFAVVSDPIGSGFAASFAHPGGNITGFTTNEPAVGGKWMELLKEIAPRTARVGPRVAAGVHAGLSERAWTNGPQLRSTYSSRQRMVAVTEPPTQSGRAFSPLFDRSPPGYPLPSLRKHVGRKEPSCNCRQFCKASRSRASCKVPPLAPWLP
jgi:ABC transporter substrate binding protein